MSYDDEYVKVGTGEVTASFEDKDFTPAQWKNLRRQARTEKIIGKKSSKIPQMAAAFREINARHYKGPRPVQVKDLQRPPREAPDVVVSENEANELERLGWKRV